MNYIIFPLANQSIRTRRVTPIISKQRGSIRNQWMGSKGYPVYRVYRNTYRYRTFRLRNHKSRQMGPEEKRVLNFTTASN